MPLSLPGQVAATLLIDGQEFPLNTNLNTQIMINANVRTLLPVAKMSLPDFGNFFGRVVPINDGSKISVNIGDGNNPAYSQQFSKFSAFGTPKRVPTRDFNVYNVTNILDAAPVVRASPNQAITGSSYNVMEQIASAMGLNLVSNVATNDSMTWRAGRNHWGNFMRNVAAHGYIDSNSLMHAAIDEQHNLHYKNITDEFANAPVKAVLYYGSSNSAPSGMAPQNFECLQYKGINRSGMLNNSRGYGLRMTQVDPLNTTVNRFTTVVAQQSGGANLDISQSILNAVTPVAKIELPPLNMGNTHPNYMLCRHQNSRLSDTYCQNVYVTVGRVTGLTLYDLVYFNANSSSNGADYSTQGYYVITAITRVMVGARYVEKLELTGSGPQADNSNLV